MNASIFSPQSRDIFIRGDVPQLETVLQQLAESVRASGRSPRPHALFPGVPRPGALPTGPEAEELVQVEMGGRIYSLMCWFRQPAQEQSALSPREREVVRLVANGLPNKTIAHSLQISAWTVATYMRRIFSKLGVSSRAEMVARALKEGLLVESESDTVAARQDL